MVDPAAHRMLVDAFGGLEPLVESTRAAHEIWRNSAKELAKLQARVEAAAKEADYLRASVDELTILSPREGEEEELAGRRQTMMAAEKIAGDISEAHDVIAGNSSPIPSLASTLRKLERKADQAPGLLDGAIEAVGVALDGLSQAESELEQALRLSEFDPQELERAEERLFALRAASRKYGVAVENLAAHAEKLTKDLADLDAGEELLSELSKRVEAHRGELVEQARRLTEAREKAGQALSEAVMAELPALKLEQASFYVRHETMADDITADGCDQMEFFVQTNPGSRPGAMMKVASGGELSRFLLALKVALADRGSAPTLVFDEIDTGVGGAVADAIGARLASLAKSVQVLSVTHAPQVAGRALSHMLISKHGEGAVETRVRSIRDDERLEEIARMLSGAEITEEARAAASRLLAAQ